MQLLQSLLQLLQRLLQLLQRLPAPVRSEEEPGAAVGRKLLRVCRVSICTGCTSKASKPTYLEAGAAVCETLLYMLRGCAQRSL